MKRSKFNLSNLNNTTLDAGYLVPFFVMDTLPGDNFRIGSDMFIRAQPMLAPLMHKVNLYTQYWYVPYRIVWDNWESFITGGFENFNDNSVFPTIQKQIDVGSLADYFGLPLSDSNETKLEVSALPFRAYAEIWNSRYRDEDLQNPVSVSYEDGPDTTTSTALLSPSWRKDYFTTARATTQRGAQISVPTIPTPTTDVDYLNEYVFTSATLSNSESKFTCPITLPDGSVGFNYRNQDPNYRWTFTDFTRVDDNTWKCNLNIYYRIWYNIDSHGVVGAPRSQYADYSHTVEINDLTITSSKFVAGDDIATPPPEVNITADGLVLTNDDQKTGSFQFTITSFSSPGKFYLVSQGSSSANIDIRALRLASSLQRYQERSLKWGNRYEEFIQREFGIKPKDSRIDRPQYLGGSKSVLQISEVLQTAEGTDSGVGTMRGHGVAGLRQRNIRFLSPEHGVILGLLSIRPDPIYTQACDRMWLKRSKLDFFTPELANVGMQEVFQQEIYAPNGTNKDVVFGYSDKYQEYRQSFSKNTGEFRTLFPYWTMQRSFAGYPVINESFINMSNSSATFKQPFYVVNGEHSFLAMIRNNVIAYRPIPKVAKNILK